MRLDEPQVPVDAARNPGEDVGGPCRRVRNTPLLTGGKDNPEARLVAHHTGVRFCGTFQGNRFDHRTNVLEDAECQSIFDKSSPRALDRPEAADQRDDAAPVNRAARGGEPEMMQRRPRLPSGTRPAV